MTGRPPSATELGQASYRAWLDELHADPDFERVYAEEAAKKELWLQWVEARQAAGLTQAELARRLGVTPSQVARIERRGYDAYTLTTIRGDSPARERLSGEAPTGCGTRASRLQPVGLSVAAATTDSTGHPIY